MKSWYSIKAKADNAEEAEISIYDEIGFWGVTAKAFINDLKNLGKVKNIVLTVNSPGGSVFDGLAIYNALKNVREGGAKITAKVMGIAASAASFIVMAADTIEMPENSMMMVHYASGGAWGNAETMRETAEILDKIDASIVGIYTARTGKSEDDVRALLKAESYLTAAEAKEAGFADVVTENVKATASFELENLPTNIQALFKAVAQEEPKTPPTATIADQVAALAKDAGLESLSAFFATNYDDVPSAEKALGVAREIKSLCALAKLEKKADGFIQAKKSIVDVRAELCNALATEDEQRPTDTAQRNDRSPQNNSQPKAISTASIWAARHKSQQGV